MVKAWIHGAGDARILVLGLSRRNTELLMEDKPIVIPPEQLGLDFPIYIVGDETEDIITAKLVQMLRDDGPEGREGEH